MVIGVQPVRARCGYRLCLTQRQATNPNNDASHLDLAAGAFMPTPSSCGIVRCRFSANSQPESMVATLTKNTDTGPRITT